MESYTRYFPYQAFQDVSQVEIIKEEQLELTPENLQIMNDYNASQEMKNVARDANDQRKRSENDWTGTKSSKDVEQSVKDYEKKLFEQAGGAAERSRIAKEMEQRQAERSKTTSTSKTKETSSQGGGDKAAAGNVAADWQLSSRTPHQNNEWYIRKPSYMCVASGRIMVLIKVNQNGDVVEATMDPSKSSSNDGCLVNYAIQYAKKSRFNYSSNAPKLQSGYILYTFVAQ